MFRNSQEKLYQSLFDGVSTPATFSNGTYPIYLSGFIPKGRYPNIVAMPDINFPNYNANLIAHTDTNHILLEGPAQRDASHCERFMEVLMNDAVVVTDIIAAGDPFEGRQNGKGYSHYFSVEKNPDHDVYENMHVPYIISSQISASLGGISSYKVTINHASHARNINVHHIPQFGDFKSMAFSIDEIKKLLEIFRDSKSLAIHCSAGVGRTGVIELAYCIFSNDEKYFLEGKPDFRAIRLKLEELRVLRPGLVQTADQYRMAIILGMELYSASRNELTDETRKALTLSADAAAKENMQGRKMLRQASCGVTSNEVSEDESSSLEDKSSMNFSSYH